MNNNSNELYHHGVIGMKWGVRRYQNRDGSLTPAGRKRVAKIESQYNKLTGKKLNKGNNSLSNKPKTIRELSNDELKERTNRLRLENDYVRETNNYNTLHPKKVSLGKKFITSIGKNVIAPAATEAGKRVLGDYLTKVGRDATGLNQKTKDPIADLKKEVETLELKKRKKIATDYLNKKNKN